MLPSARCRGRTFQPLPSEPRTSCVSPDVRLVRDSSSEVVEWIRQVSGGPDCGCFPSYRCDKGEFAGILRAICSSQHTQGLVDTSGIQPVCSKTLSATSSHQVACSTEAGWHPLFPAGPPQQPRGPCYYGCLGLLCPQHPCIECQGVVSLHALQPYPTSTLRTIAM